MTDITHTRDELLARIPTLERPADILKADEIKQLYAVLPTLPAGERAEFGRQVNELKRALEVAAQAHDNERESAAVVTIDVTAPFDVNANAPTLLPTEQGTIHPLNQEIRIISDILQRMGMQVYESREIDDQYHMFEALNFPKGHPARDDYDTFMTEETDKDGESFIAPAHTSTMQNRILTELRTNLENGEPIAAVAIDRCFRNEDLDARHEHTFYQHEGIYVARGVHTGMLVATLKTFLESYYGKSLNVRINPFYFPFTEPSFEFALSCPFCVSEADGDSGGNGCHICSQSGWIELLGCGMIHPNVLKAAGIDSNVYTGFAWGGGVERLVMMKYGIEDIRYFESGKLDFLRQF